MSSNPHILYLTYDGLTDPLGSSQVLPYLKALSRKGYTITVISSEKKSRFRAHSDKVEEEIAPYPINWEHIFYTKSPPILSTFWDLYRIYRKATSLCQQTSFRVVHCRSQLAALVGLRLKKQYKTQFLFDMRGFLADERVEGGLWNLKNPVYNLVYRYFKRKEREFFDQADYLVCLTDKARHLLRQQQNPHPVSIPIQVIPCTVDTQRFDPGQVDPQAQEALRQELGLRPDDWTLTYLGSIGTWYLLEEMLAFYKQLQQSYPSARFLFITPNQHRQIRQSARHLNLTPFQILVTEAYYPQIPTLLSISTLSVFFIKPTYSKQASSPTKQAELLSMGVPIITNEGIGDTTEILEKVKGGALVNNFTTEEYDRVIRQAVPQLLQLSPDEIRQGAIDHLSLESGVRKYEQVYRSLTQEAEA